MGLFTITFEGIADKSTDWVAPVQNGYDGFDWDNISALDVNGNRDKGQPGFKAALHSGNSDAYNSSGDDAGFSNDTHFKLKSLWVAAASQPSETITFQGLRDGDVVTTKTVTIHDHHARFVHFDKAWHDLGAVSFSTGEQTGSAAAIDDIKVFVKGANPNGAMASPDHTAMAEHSADATHASHAAYESAPMYQDHFGPPVEMAHSDWMLA